MENCTSYEVERKQCKSCDPKPYLSDTVIYNKKAYISKEKGLGE